MDLLAFGTFPCTREHRGHGVLSCIDLDQEISRSRGVVNTVNQAIVRLALPTALVNAFLPAANLH